jgi:hypothetical protein
LNTTRSLTISSRQARVSGEGSPATERWSYKGDEHRRGNTLPSPANFLKFSTPPRLRKFFAPHGKPWKGLEFAKSSSISFQNAARAGGMPLQPRPPLFPLRPYKRPVNPPQKAPQKAKKVAFFRAFSRPSGRPYPTFSISLKLTTLSTDCFDQQQQTQRLQALGR